MSVRSSLVAILTMGPAYGFQLHGELHARTAGRRQVNVGQIYSTLERLLAQGVVESAGTTPDGLPLYSLTVAGRAEAEVWLHETISSPGDEWAEMLERVLIASSLPHVDVAALVTGYRAAWTERAAGLPSPDASGQAAMSAAADSAQARAALAWLDTVDVRVRSGIDLHRELNLVRPKRGRRPSAGYFASA